MDPAGADFVVVLFTDGTTSVGLIFTGKERSKIARNGRELCGTIATGEIFNCGGGLALSSVHRTNHACLEETFSLISSSNCAIAAGNNAETWGPRLIAACICWIVHGAPVIVGHPPSAYLVKVPAAGW